MLMRMQMADTSNELTVRDVLHQSINRIQTIAAVHEVLSEQGFRLVDVKDVVTRIVYMVGQNMIPPGKKIEIVVEGDSLTLPSRPATSLALIITELVQNSLEHAFVGRDSGKVTITLAPAAKSSLVTVADNGVGLPSEIPSSLGLEIVDTLVRDDLKGKIKFKRTKGGAQIEISLPRQNAHWAEA
jgi:two-component sensor histidine kinase